MLSPLFLYFFQPQEFSGKAASSGMRLFKLDCLNCVIL